ncbi:MAG: hypothetical protein KAU21_18320 [Gammaproteobacteria bacterium]|nr:hypothetical protein [Gammaproteobacteria bacterium]
MKLYINRIIGMAIVFMMMSLPVFASEENKDVLASVNTSPALSADPMSGSYLLQLVIGLFIV